MRSVCILNQMCDFIFLLYIILYINWFFCQQVKFWQFKKANKENIFTCLYWLYGVSFLRMQVGYLSCARRGRNGEAWGCGSWNSTDWSLDTVPWPNNELHNLGTQSSSHLEPNTRKHVAQNSPSSFLAWHRKQEHAYCLVSLGIWCYWLRDRFTFFSLYLIII